MIERHFEKLRADARSLSRRTLRAAAEDRTDIAETARPERRPTEQAGAEDAERDCNRKLAAQPGEGCDRQRHDATAEQAFREIARLTGGAWCRFDPGAAAQLGELLRAAAAYAAGGREALLRLSKTASGAAALIGQMK